MERARMGTATQITRRPLSSLAKVAIGALLVNTLAQFVGVIAEFVQGEGLNVPHLVIGIILLAVALLMTTGARWSFFVGAATVFITHILLITRPTNYTALLNPGANAGHFVVLLVTLGSALVAMGAGIAAGLRAGSSNSPQQ